MIITAAFTGGNYVSNRFVLIFLFIDEGRLAGDAVGKRKTQLCGFDCLFVCLFVCLFLFRERSGSTIVAHFPSMVRRKSCQEMAVAQLWKAQLFMAKLSCLNRQLWILRIDRYRRIDPRFSKFSTVFFVDSARNGSVERSNYRPI